MYSAVKPLLVCYMYSTLQMCQSGKLHFIHIVTVCSTVLTCQDHSHLFYFCTTHPQFTTAIVSSTTITHLFFIDYDIDTPSLTALASGLKQNRTMEELAIDHQSKYFTKDQFQMLIEGIDSSAVKKLWLYHHKNLLSDFPLSRDDVVIEWYYGSNDVYKKWWPSQLLVWWGQCCCYMYIVSLA